MLEIQENVSLLKYNTFHINAKAKYFVIIKSEQDIYELLQNKVFLENKRFFLWWGSNTLFTSNFDGIVVKNEIMWKERVDQNQDFVLVKAGAGEQRNAFVFWCCKNNLWWLENLISIPWTVGASPIQNIGAYGVEVKDSIFEVEWINMENWEIEKLRNDDCRFSYRDSIFKHELKDKFIVTSVVFKLKRVDSDSNYKFNLNYKDILQKMSNLNLSEKDLTIQKFIDIIISLRAGKLPNYHEVGTAWSFFKNPVIKKSDYIVLKEKYPEIVWFETENWIKLSAWRVIEKAWFKWIRKWNVWVYDWHALILVNYGWTWEEVIALENKIKSKIKEEFNIILESEVVHI